MMVARITDALARHAAVQGVALACADAQQALTWRALDAAVTVAEIELTAQGVQAGDRVAVCLPDGVGALVQILAVLRLGAVHAPVDHQLTTPEISAAVTAVGARWLVRPEGIEATGLPPIDDPLGPGRSAFIRLTSGTTGAAKGVLIAHDTLLARIVAANKGLALTADDRVLWLLPMAYHLAVSVLLYIEVGAAIIFGNRLRATQTAQCATDHGCTFAYGSPWHVRRLAELSAGALPPSLRRIVSTTTALDADCARLLRERHGIPVQQALGIIECGLPLISAGAVDEPVGRFVVTPEYSAAIHGADGEPVAPGTAGDLVLSGPGFLDAYLEPWRPRAQILRAGRWFVTGDLAREEADGSFQLLGRSTDVINVGGLKVFPLEVEAVLLAHPDVVAARVRAETDARTGEHVVAEVQVRPGAQADLSAWCTARLAPLKRPAAITVVDTLPMTPSGKVRR